MEINEKGHINKAVVLLSASAGIIIWRGCYLIYSSYRDSLPGPAMMGILCSALFFVVFLSVWAGSVITGSLDENSSLYEGIQGQAVRFLLGFFAVFLISMVLEFLYEVNPHIKAIEPSSYVFVIDESGSMNSNDPTGLRYEAIREIMQAEYHGFPYMVYAFSNDTKILRDMRPSDDDYELPVSSDGGTAIRGAILQILNDYKNGVWDGGVNPKIIFLTDGAATDLSGGFLWFKGNMPEFNAALEEYHDLGINISTVGLGSVDREIMVKMAETTGGVFVNIQNASDLASAMKTAAITYSDRDLLSIRYMRHMDWFYAVLRIVFLSIIGTVIGVLIIFAYVEDHSSLLIIVSSIVCSVMGSIMFEFGLRIGAFQSLLWSILWVLFSLTFGFIYPKAKDELGDKLYLIHTDSYLHIE